MSKPDLKVRRLSGSLGAEVFGLSLRDANESYVELITNLLLEHMVLFFPDQDLTPDEHIKFGRLFGELESHPNLQHERERPEFFELRAFDGKGGIADEWHSDLSCEQFPSLISILHARVMPEVGGDTMWTNAAAAYEALSAPLQDLCDGLTAYHNAQAHAHPERGYIHPVVRVHPVTGRKSLFVNDVFTRRIIELSDAESTVLLSYLIRWVQEPRFTVRYRWRAGTIAMWDNRCTQHYVLNDFEGERVIQRVTIMGDEPKGAVPLPRWPLHGAKTGAHWRDTEIRRQLSLQREAN